MRHTGILGPALALLASGELEKDNEWLELKWEEVLRQKLATNPGNCVLPDYLTEN